MCMDNGTALHQKLCKTGEYHHESTGQAIYKADMNAVADKMCEWKTKLKLWVQTQDGKGRGRERYGKKEAWRQDVCVFVSVWGFPAAASENWWSNGTDKWAIKLTCSPSL